MDNKNTNGSNWHKWDLHMHSTASDGKATPSELIDEAVSKGLSVIALTDHHTVDNLDETKSIGKEKGIVVISGIEFRTEYGQKSVHMIGLFPDRYENTALNQENLYDLILCQLGLSRAKVRALAREEKNIPDDVKAYKEGLLKATVDFKDAADLIHKYGGIVTVHSGQKANSIEEMRHEGNGPRNTSVADSLGPVKDDLMNNYIDICEVTKAKEAEFYNKVFHKAGIAASDAHTKGDVARNFVWIKGTTNFEGLRQIIFEPASRVRIQQEEPDVKNDYQIIDCLEINHADFGHQIIPFNPGLNTIIGGRSSGKSILLGSIAKLSGNTRPVKKSSKAGYNEYIETIIKSMKISWRDRTTGGVRKVEYFPQGYIIDIASSPSEISKIVYKIIQSDSTLNSSYEQLQQDLRELKKSISGKVDTFFTTLDDLNRARTVLHDLGNKEGIKKEIEKIQASIDQIRAAYPEKLTEEQEVHYKKCMADIDKLNAQIKTSQASVLQFSKLQTIDLVKPLDEFLTELSDESVSKVQDIYHELKTAFVTQWKSRIGELILSDTTAQQSASDKIARINSDEKFIKIQQYYAGNSEYDTLSQRLKQEKEKLTDFETKEKTVETLRTQIKQLQAEIIGMQNRYHVLKTTYCSATSIIRDDIEIIPYVEFKGDEFIRFTENRLDRRPFDNQKYLSFVFESAESFEKLLTDFVNKLNGSELSLKGGYTHRQVLKELVENDWYNVRYNIRYQHDDLSRMSEGKSAFVILRLLLDFTDDDCPILIDQPEDELDNRAIYTELVKYIREKKCKRQMILVTHNPNIVVGSDSEEVIVANQHGSNSINQDDVKFEYYSGALENSFKSDNNQPLLISQGIREHVCDILEGGVTAFMEREKKYHIGR